MIKSLRGRDTALVFSRQRSPGLPAGIQQVAYRKLRMLNNAHLRVPPRNRLEKLIGDREGQCNIRITERWRVCFEWRDGDAYEVEIVDYH